MYYLFTSLSTSNLFSKSIDRYNSGDSLKDVRLDLTALIGDIRGNVDHSNFFLISDCSLCGKTKTTKSCGYAHFFLLK